jgi:hypothetical protein
MQVKLKPVRAFDVIGSEGTIRLMVQKGPAWNGLVELITEDGKKLIVLPNPVGSFSAMLAEIFGEEHAIDAQLVSGSPSLLLELGLPENLPAPPQQP